MKAEIQRKIPETVILAFEAAITSDEVVGRAALSRIAEMCDRDLPAIVVCAEPIAMANALAHLGLRTVTVPTENRDAALVRELVQAGVVPVLEGEGDQAIALAVSVRGASVIIYTTGKVLMSGDPQRVRGATRINRVSHLELLELAEPQGVPVRLRVASDAHAQGIPYEIRDVHDGYGTAVRQDGHEDRCRPITSIGVSKGFDFVSVRPREGEEETWLTKRAEVLECLTVRGVSVEMLQFTPSRMRFVISESVVTSTRDILQECSATWRLVSNCSKITMVGTGIRTTAGVFYRTFTVLAERDVPVLHFSDSGVTVSLIVPDANAAAAESLLHDLLARGSGSSFHSPISFDAALGKVRVRGEERRLGARQAKLLEFLIDNVGRVVEAEEAALYLFGSDGKEDVAALRVHMHNLRKKIEDDPDNPRFIVTVPAQGYLFVR